MGATDQSRELGAFLRSRRERRRPEQVGVAAGGRRRTPGLRREEVAMLAGLSITWYTWLEQGRNVRASRQVLSSLVDVLGLDQVETAHMFRLAGEMPPRVPGASAPGPYQLLLDQLDPCPAFLMSRRLDLAAWNRSAELLYGDLAFLEPSRRNILWLTFTSDEIRSTSDDWEADAAQTVAFFRAAVGPQVSDPAVAGLIADLQAESEDFRRLWQLKNLAALASERRAVYHPKLGRVDLELTKLQTLDSEQLLVAYLAPRESELARQLAALH